MAVQEEERRRLARELHDDFGQRTAILELQASRALQVLSDNVVETRQLLQQMSEHISALDRGLRNASHRLHPSVLADLGLVAGLRSLVDDFCQSGGDATLWAPDQSLDVPVETTTALYRIAQEALRNAMKHAPGAPVRITLLSNDQGFQLTIEDAGPGFRLEQAKAGKGLGLLSMQERARLAGGVLLLSTRLHRGTVVSVRVPAGLENARP
jgi:two-component system CheB/CheR fusion protein